MIEIVGFKRVQGKYKDGNPFSGYRIWFTEPDDNVTGQVANTEYLPDSLLKGRVPALHQNAVLIYRPGTNGKAYLNSVEFV